MVSKTAISVAAAKRIVQLDAWHRKAVDVGEADPISPDSRSMALDILGCAKPEPDIVYNPTGYFQLEWYDGPTRHLVVQPRERGAALFLLALGDSRRIGHCAPDTIPALLREWKDHVP